MAAKPILWLSLLVACSGEIGSPAPSTPSPPRSPGDVVTPDGITLLPTVVRRLTGEELVHTLEDVLGVRPRDAALAQMPADRPLEGFVNVATAQTVSPDHVLAYAAVARDVASQLDDGALVALTGCDEASCGSEVARSLASLLYRRPPIDREVGSLEALFQSAIDEGASVHEATRFVLEAALQSPSFLYLVEEERADESQRRRSGWELASRLSYFLWSSAPDEALRSAAERGDLDTEEGLEAQATRMLDDPRAARSTARFLVDWAGLESIPDDDGLRDALTESAIAFYVDHLQNDRPLVELLTSERAFLNATLAEHQGLEAADEALRAYDLTDVPGHVGLLTQPGVIAGMTNADGGAIVARGLFLQRQLFCGESPDFPATLQDAIDDFVAELPETASDRAIAEARLERDDCATCHASFDPLAYAFERFDFRGGFRTADEHGNTLRTDGWIPSGLTPDGESIAYDEVEDYVTELAALPRVRDCLVRRHLEHALSARLHGSAARQVGAFADALDDAGGSRAAFVRLLVQSELFRSFATEAE